MRTYSDHHSYCSVTNSVLTVKVLVKTINAQWEGMGDVGSARYEPALLPPMPDHKSFKLQQLVNFQKFSTLRVKKNVKFRPVSQSTQYVGIVLSPIDLVSNGTCSNGVILKYQ